MRIDSYDEHQSDMPDHEPPTEAVVLRSANTPNAVARTDAPMGVSDIIGQVKLIQDVMGKVMQEGEHYGLIPGCGNRKTLLQPGAQKLTMTFRLAPEYQIQETNFQNGHKEYRVICTLKSIASGSFVGQGVGCCSTLESKYRWKGGARKCPECGKETIIKGKAEYGGGWLCFAKKGGCGAKWTDGAKEIESQNVEKVEHDSPADFYNTVLKMAKKRAFVDATITATAASDIFTQDVGDAEGDEGQSEPSKTSSEAPEPARPQRADRAQKAPATPKSAKASPKPEPEDKEAGWDKFLVACKTKLLANIDPEFEWAWWAYAVEKGWILPSGSGESLADANPLKIFEGYDRANFKESIAQIAEHHMKTAMEFAESCDPGLRDEIQQRGMTSMLARTKTQAPENKESTTTVSSRATGCPNCQSTAVQGHDDLEGVAFCQKCGFQWKRADPKKEEYEEHEWMYALLPFAPKDPAKKSYKGMSLGQLCRIDNPYWFGIVKNFEATPFKGRPPSEESVKFGEACAAARAHLERQKEEDPGEDPTGRAMSPADDDIPF
jgi:ssDNA-binding Zn-finger/Zn-ribbon topoisomerase 1